MNAPLGRVLIVDDDDVDREKFRRLATRGGLKLDIVEAASGAEALRLVGEQRFDTIVLDYRLGDTTGIELIRAIRAREPRPLPIIMVTGLGDERVAVSAIREGVHEYLTKSNLTVADVAQAVTSALRRAELECKLVEATAARELAEQSLSQSRQQFDDARQMVLLGTIYIDIENGEQRWSDEIYRLQGLQPGSCIPSRELFFQRVHPDDLMGLNAVEEHFTSSHEPFRHEHRLLLDDGTVRHVLANGRVINDSSGAPRQLVVLVQDVTALRQAELIASHREAQIQGLFDASGKGILFAKTDGSVLRVNPAMCRLSGYTESELVALCWTTLVRSDDDPSTADSLRGRVDVHDAECLLCHKDGSSVYVSINISPVRDAFHTVVAVAVLVQDMRERHRAQNLLRESERRFRTLVTGAPIGIFETDANNSCTFVNEAWTQITGWPASEAIGRNGGLLLHPEDRATVLAEWERARAERRDYAAEFRFLSPEAREIWVSCKIRATVDDRGLTTGYLGTIMDITDRKAQQSALIAAKEAAEAAARVKTDFLAKISHEIRTPMNSVIGMTDLTLKTELQVEQREFLEIANGAARSLLHLINDILDFSRVEAGALSLEQIPFDVCECVASTVRHLEYRAQEKGLELLVELPKATLRLLGDPYRLAQVLSNLVGNAIKFTERGKVLVSLNATMVGEARCALQFSVLDTGIGVPLDKRALIFEAFAQADDGVSRRFGGTGLGLAICAQVLNLMKGRLWVDSEQGRGSNFQFSIELPLASDENELQGELTHDSRKLEEMAESTPHALSGAANLPEAERATLNILVAEDNLMNQRLIQALLRRAGHRATMVNDGSSALDQLQAARFDLVLMDVQMPGMSGLEAVRRLRASEGNTSRRVPVVALTAQAMHGDEERCLEAGMDGYVAKPIKVPELERIMVRVLLAANPEMALAGSPQVSLSALPYDPAILERRVGRDAQLYEELCGLFEPRAALLLSQLEAALLLHAAEPMRSAAHELKGMLLNLAATEASEAARELEAAVSAAEFPKAERCLARLTAEVPRLLAALRASARSTSQQQPS